jgi:hypothetical protein
VVAAVAGAGLRVAMTRWAGADGRRPLADFVHEAFGVLATGLAEPTDDET